MGARWVIRGEVWGNLYLTEKEGGRPFDEADEQVAVVLAAGRGSRSQRAAVHARTEAAAMT